MTELISKLIISFTAGYMYGVIFMWLKHKRDVKSFLNILRTDSENETVQLVYKIIRGSYMIYHNIKDGK